MVMVYSVTLSYRSANNNMNDAYHGETLAMHDFIHESQ